MTKYSGTTGIKNFERILRLLKKFMNVRPDETQLTEDQLLDKVRQDDKKALKWGAK